MPDLQGRSVFVSASFPSIDERGDAFRPYDPQAIADAVTAVTHAILAAGGQLVCGGHPTITPLVLRLARRHGRRGVVLVYQSEFFAWRATEPTRELQRQGYGEIVPTENEGTRVASLATMRRRMLTEPSNLCGAVFIGGMDGIDDEFKAFGSARPGRPRMPLHEPGGAAARVAESRSPEDFDLPAGFAPSLLFSTRYPLVATRMVAAMAAAPEPMDG